MWWLLIPGIIILLAYLPLGLDVRYDEKGLYYFLKIGPFRVLTSEDDDEKKDKSGKKSATQINTGTEKKGGPIKEFWETLKTALNLLNGLRTRVKIKRLELKLVMASDDPADLGINYGRAWMIIGNIIPLLEQAVYIKKRKFDVGCDFEGEDATISVKALIGIPLWKLISFILASGMDQTRAYIDVINSGKDGKK